MKQVAQLTDWSSKSFFQNEQIQRAQNRFRKWNFRIEKISKQPFSLNVIKPKKNAQSIYEIQFDIQCTGKNRRKQDIANIMSGALKKHCLTNNF